MNDKSGWIKLHRKIIDSQVFQNEGLLKVWLWCLCKAGHKETWVSVKTGRGITEVKVLPGQFIFGRKTAAKELKMHPETVRKRMMKLKSMQNLTIKSTTKYSIISVVNWDVYQGEDKKVPPKVPTKYQPSTTNKNDKNEENKKDSAFFLSEIRNLKKRYLDPDIIDRTLDALRTTRKSNRIANSVIFGLLQSLDKYPVQTVQAGCHIYLEKSYHTQGKDEKYLMGIVRKQADRLDQTQARQSTGSPLLDAYYDGKLRFTNNGD